MNKTQIFRYFEMGALSLPTLAEVQGATNRPYSGCNVILLWLARNRGWSTPRFLTFKQTMETGGHVRKGEHGTKVFFVKQLQVKDNK
jgi:antirestriction protein ArdC